MSDAVANSKIVPPALHHYGLTTANPQPMLDWYAKVLGMKSVHQSTKPAGVNSPLGARADWITNDQANQRIAIISFAGLTEDHERSHHKRLQHVAFELPSVDDLLAAYARLKGQGIEPVLTTDTGATTAFYYEAPDRNIVELLADNFGDWRKSTEFMRTSPEFAARPIGNFVDPEAVIAARAAGISAEEVHRRACAGEYPPSKPMDPQVLM